MQKENFLTVEKMGGQIPGHPKQTPKNKAAKKKCAFPKSLTDLFPSPSAAQSKS